MKLSKLGLTVLAVLPLMACGAAPEGDLNDGTSAEGMSGPVRQPPRLINFDDDGFGTAVTDGEDVSGVYAMRGVTFTCQGACSGSPVLARAPGESGNGVSVRSSSSAQSVPQPEFDASFGVIRATFLKPAAVVTLDAFTPAGATSISGTTAGAPWLRAYDSAGNELDEDNYTANSGTWATLSVASSTYDIAYVEFSSSTPTAKLPTRGRFDNLTFDQQIIKQPPILPAPTGTPVLPPRIQ